MAPRNMSRIKMTAWIKTLLHRRSPYIGVEWCKTKNTKKTRKTTRKDKKQKDKKKTKKRSGVSRSPTTRTGACPYRAQARHRGGMPGERTRTRRPQTKIQQPKETEKKKQKKNSNTRAHTKNHTGLFAGHDLNPRVRSGSFRISRVGVGRAGSGQEVFKSSRVGLCHPSPSRPDLTREVWFGP